MQQVQMSANQMPTTYRYNLSNHKAKNYQCITLGDNIVHRIANVDEFCAALGYTDEMKQTRLVFDEFIWEEYTKDNARQSQTALQDKIVQYLKQHCPSFNQ